MRHSYNISVNWTGNSGQGTASYQAYERSYIVTAQGKPELQGSSDPVFRGDPGKYNPEELLLAALSSCHMLMYLHLCAVAGVVVTGYKDNATGEMTVGTDGGGRFSEVTLHPEVIVAEAFMIEKANALHQEASRRCFIASSCNFPVHHAATAVSEGKA